MGVTNIESDILLLNAAILFEVSIFPSNNNKLNGKLIQNQPGKEAPGSQSKQG